MDSSHPVRHRFGVVLFCLIAPLTAREAWNAPRQGSNLNLPEIARAAPRGLPEFHVDGEHVASQKDSGLPYPIAQAIEVPCCNLALRPPAEADLDFVFALSPETFPLVAQFMPEPLPDDATINPALLEVAKKVEPLHPDSYIVWLPPLSKCSNVKKDSQGKEYCAPDDLVEVPEPASLLLVLGGGTAFLLSMRHRR